MARSRNSGFTLIELVVVVAIVGILTSLAVAAIQRSRVRTSIDQGMAEVRGHLERAQGLSARAGSRLGTARLIRAPSCTGFPDNTQLWISQVGTILQIPTTLAYNAATDQLTVTCGNFDLNTIIMPAGTAIYAPPATNVNAAQFAFSPAGRVVLPAAGARQDVYLQIRPTNGDVKFNGIRILPSGVMCRSDTDNPAAPCDEDT